jgi:transposase
MWYVGLDVHVRQSTFCILDEHGQKVRVETIKGSWDKVFLALTKIKEPWAICFEASTGYGVLWRRLQGMAQRVVVAHPGHLRLIFRSKRKNDRIDAERLAKLLYLNEVPAVHVPSATVLAWRGLIAHRNRLVQERTAVKNGMRALLRGQGIVAPKSLWSRVGIAWLRALELPTLLDALRRDQLLERLLTVQSQIKRVEKELNRIGDEHPSVILLRTIPGVGLRTAEAVVAYLDDVQRFAQIKQVSSYFGLVPSQDSSANVNRLGHITRQGPALVRRLLTEAAWQGIRRSPHLRAYFERIKQDNPERKKIALVATGHHLLRSMVAMLRSGEVWREEPSATSNATSAPATGAERAGAPAPTKEMEETPAA